MALKRTLQPLLKSLLVRVKVIPAAISECRPIHRAGQV
jgi:hypothetical protein